MRSYKKYIFFLLLIIIYPLFSINYQPKYIELNNISKVKDKYGSRAESRVILWDKMLDKYKDESILKKLKGVNDFFNKIPYRTDPKHWKKRDYWATPFEFLGSGAGDCEDYAIAKYFSLRKLGVPEEKLRISYVIYKRNGTKYEEAHMVLSYIHKANATPIILDNINKKLILASKRKDLRPIYSFNASGLWKAQTKGSVKVGSNNLKSWQNLVSRI